MTRVMRQSAILCFCSPPFFGKETYWMLNHTTVYHCMQQKWGLGVGRGGGCRSLATTCFKIQTEKQTNHMLVKPLRKTNRRGLLTDC